MASIFISYNRDNESIVKRLAEDIEGLGHSVWLDHELSGGQAWWDQILKMIRSADIFVLALSPQALQSAACRSEFNYADQLEKTILPIQISDGISANLLPAAISKLQIVDYREQGREELLCLGRALTNIPSPKPLPNPLPQAPDVPLSYLGGLREKIESEERLDYETQSALLLDLKSAFRNNETQADARILLIELKSRRDLLANVSEEIDDILKNERQQSGLPVSEKAQPAQKPQDNSGDKNNQPTGESHVVSIRKPQTNKWKAAALVSLGVACTLSVLIISWVLLTKNKLSEGPKGDAGEEVIGEYGDQLYNKKFQMSYTGEEGVNLRPAPQKKPILAALLNREIMLPSLSEKAKYVGGIPWIEVKISGWMVTQGSRGRYITLTGENSGIVSWDGNGNEDDRFVKMRTDTRLDANEIAQIPTDTKIKILTSRNVQGRDWVNAELTGWVALKSYSGLTLMKQVSR